MWKSRHACVLSVTDVWQSLPWQGVERCKISAIKFHEQNTQRLNWRHLPNSQEKINYFKVDSSLIMMFRSVSCYTSHSQAAALKKLRLGFFFFVLISFLFYFLLCVISETFHHIFSEIWLQWHYEPCFSFKSCHCYLRNIACGANKSLPKFINSDNTVTLIFLDTLPVALINFSSDFIWQ